ncbi:MAG: prepilin peptidase [Patescibacteria group bacterium]
MLELIFFIFGLIIGSFANVVIFRLIKEKSILGRSVCQYCLRQLAWYENIPLVSFIVLRGKCLTCRKKISWQYPAVELASGILWMVGYLVIAKPEAVAISEIASSRLISGLAMTPVEWTSVIIFGIFSTILLILFVFDLRWYILPDIITIPGIFIALLINLIVGKDWLQLVISAAVGAVWFLLQYVLSRGKWVGSGDIRLGALLGAMLGSWQGLLVTFLLAYIVGSLVAIVLVALKKKQWQSQLPFGTFLAVAGVITLLWGWQLWDWYLALVW